MAVDPCRSSRVGAAVAGDRAATAALVAALLPRVRNLVRYLVRGDGEVDDIAQEALVAIVRALPLHRAEGTLCAWADRITWRVAVAHRSRRQRLRGLVDSDADLEAVQDPGGRGDDYAARRKAVASLDALPAEQRHALVLHHVLGHSVPEIARELDVPQETVRSRLRIGIARLRELHAVEHA